MRVDLAQVEWRDVQVLIRDGQEHSAVDRRVTLKCRHVGLDRVGRVAGHIQQGRVCGVELGNPKGILGRTRASASDVAVIGANGLSRLLPLQEDLAARVRQRLGAVVSDGWRTVLADGLLVDTALSVLDTLGAQRVGIITHGLVPNVRAVDAHGVRLVEDVQGGEVLPDELVLAGRAGRDVRGQEGPRPRLGDAALEPHGHGEETAELAEDHLLAGLGGDGLQQELADLASIEVVEEAVDTGLAPSSELLAEVDVLADVHGGIVVGALLRSIVA